MSTHHRPVHRIRRVLAVSVGGLAVLTSLAACGDEDESSSEPDPGALTSSRVTESATAGAAWLDGQLTDGVLYNDQYQVNDYSTTVELAYALMAVDVELAESDNTGLDEITAALEAGIEEYATPGKEIYAGSLAKLTSYATDTGADPRDFGGVDVVGALEEQTADDGTTAGRIGDVSEYGDYANSFGQAWAVRGLTNADSAEAAAARDFLLLQQCEDGYLRQDFSAPGAKDQSCDAAGGEASTDATALAVVLLHDVAEDDAELADALDAAVAWLVSEQAEDGSYVGSSQLPTNSNSTGLAGWALQLAGEDEAASAAAEWVLAHQVPEDCGGLLADAAGAIAYDDAALSAAAAKGITVKTAYQWRLATAQAVPALLATPDGAEPAACPTS
ncbi:hypothetical protein SFC88_19040 [Nocardioides sp. HM23]|uniref:hypothetical protein n=1 Tax=Nocardioides bizhenqiangii TaxID=3095076 RepID=UPI002ACA56B4|nr:hypothetical protein [Nocardioides sp. HM23]MDZ5622944.1 hypothetical protein [Nocardioides sp. HM23]